MTENFNILLTNLKLLDFDKLFPKEYSNMNSSAFNKSNSNLMCIIIYFLLNIEDIKYKDLFSMCYPVTTLKELKDFKEIAFIEIKNQIENNSHSNFAEILISKTVLDNASGEKLIYLLRLLSDKIIQTQIKNLRNTKNDLNFESDFFPQKNSSAFDKKEDQTRINNSIPLSNFYKSKSYLQMKKNSLLINILQSKNKLIENAKKFHSIQSRWKIFANELTSELQSLEKEKDYLEKSLKNFKKTQVDFSIFNELASLDRAPKLENHKVFLSMINKMKENLDNKSEFANNLHYINEKDNNIYDNLNTELLLNDNTERDSSEIIFLHEKVNKFNELLSINLLHNNSKEKRNLDLSDINKNITQLINEHRKSVNDLDRLILELNNCE